MIKDRECTETGSAQRVDVVFISVKKHLKRMPLVMVRNFLLAIALIPAVAAEAVTFGSEFGIGWTYFDEAENGAWHQDPLQFKYDRKAVSFTAGLVIKFDNKPWRLHTGIQYMGSTSSYARASASDHNYLEWLAGEAPLWPLSDLFGSGKLSGLYLALSHDFGSVYIKGGLWLHQPTWKIAIPNWRCPTLGDDVCIEDQPGALPSSQQISLLLRNEGNIEVGALLGIGRRWSNIEIEFSLWQVRKGGTYFPLYRGFAHNLAVRMHF